MPTRFHPFPNIALIVAACVSAAVLGSQPYKPRPAPAREDLLTDITAFERIAADAVRTLEERQNAADRAIERRARLISAAADDPRRISWLIDQASALLARLSRDASDTALLHAVPTQAQRESIGRTAGEATALLDSARRAAGSITEQQTRLSLRQGDEGNELLAALRDEQVRGAFVRGRALVLTASLATGPERRVQAQAAIDALGGILMEEPAAEAARRANLAAALLLRNEEGDARAAMTSLDFAAGEQRTGRPGTLPGTAAEALLGRLRAAPAADLDQCVADLARSRDRPPRTVRGAPDPLWHLLFADAVGRAYAERYRTSREASLLRKAFEPHQAILDGRPDLGQSPDERRAVVWDRMDALVGLLGDPLPLEAVPPPALLARAVALARRGDTDTAQEVFSFLAGLSTAGPVRADALWELGVLADGRGDAAAAAAITTRFAREFPGDPRASAAIAHALHHAAQAWQSAPGDRAAPRREYIRALTVATGTFPTAPDADRWRLDLAALLTESPDDADRTEALALLEAIPPASPLASEADTTYDRLQSAHLDALRKTLAEARRRADEAEVRALGARLATDARRAAAWAGTRGRPTLGRYLADQADGQVEAGTPDDAAGIYRDVLARAGQVPGGTLRLRLGLGRALLLSGDEAGGFAALREAVTPLDALDPGAARPDEYWHAWTLMLETLARRGGDSAGTARVRMRRLEAIDPALGGEPWRTRIRAAAER